MYAVTARWPKGTGQWNRTEILGVSADQTHRERLVRLWSEQHHVLTAETPLEVIAILEAEGLQVSTIVISDLVGSALEHELVEFLDACYPWLRILTAYERT